MQMADGLPPDDPGHPLLIAFAAPSALRREIDRPSTLPIIGNGPPGTFVVFADGWQVSLPTDQIVFADDSSGCVRVAFGGMAFVGVEAGQLVCARVREVQPEEFLSPHRSHRMQLDPRWVTSIEQHGRLCWP